MAKEYIPLNQRNLWTGEIAPLVARGAVPLVRIDGRVQFDVRDLDKLIEGAKS